MPREPGSDPALLDVDPNGDLILDVSSEDTKRSIRVSSRTLCLASPVFRALLRSSDSSDFQEGTAFQTLRLADDNYDALLLVMNAMHLRTRKIPLMTSIDAFYKIAVVCDKYDLAEILLPWVSVWTDCFRDVAKKPGYERWFLISWVFRQSKIFNQVTRELMLNTRLGRDNHLKTTSIFGNIENGSIPSSVIDAIRDGRARVISSLTSLALNEMDKYNSAILSEQSICKKPTNHRHSLKRTACDTIAVGTLHRCLLVAEIWPVQKSTRRKVASIIKALESIGSFGSEIVESISNKRSPANTHASCGSKGAILIGVTKVLNDLDGLKLSDFYSNDLIFFPDEGSEDVETMDSDDDDDDDDDDY